MSRRHVDPNADDALILPETLQALLGYNALRVHLRLRTYFDRAIGDPMALRPVEFTLLAILAVNGAQSAKALAKAVAVKAPNLSAVLERLVDRKLVSREPNPHDRRSVLIRLAPAGRRLYQRAAKVSEAMEDEALSRLDKHEREQFLMLARRIWQSGDQN